MTIPVSDHRPFGRTGLNAPPIFFRSEILGDGARVIPDQMKRVICGEWFQQVTPPVFIDVAAGGTRDAGLILLGRMLKRLDVAADEVVINLRLSLNAKNSLPNQAGIISIRNELVAAGELLGETYLPRLATLEGFDDRSSPVCISALQAMNELKAEGRIAGVGVRSSDRRIVERLSDTASFDFVTLVGGFTIMRHPPELVKFLTSLAKSQIAVVSAGVFHGGFLVGGTRFDQRIVNPDDSADKQLFAWRKAFASLCHGHGVRPAHACIQFALSAAGVVAVSLSTSHPDRVSENAESVVSKVPDALWASMKEEQLLAEGHSHLSN